MKRTLAACIGFGLATLVAAAPAVAQTPGAPGPTDTPGSLSGLTASNPNTPGSAANTTGSNPNNPAVGGGTAAGLGTRSSVGAPGTSAVAPGGAGYGSGSTLDSTTAGAGRICANGVDALGGCRSAAAGTSSTAPSSASTPQLPTGAGTSTLPGPTSSSTGAGSASIPGPTTSTTGLGSASSPAAGTGSTTGH